MNTLNKYSVFIKSERARENVIILDDLEFCFSKEQLADVKMYHNQGKGIRDISALVKRNEYEVLLALLHFHRERELTRPFGGVA